MVRASSAPSEPTGWAGQLLISVESRPASGVLWKLKPVQDLGQLLRSQLAAGPRSGRDLQSSPPQALVPCTALPQGEQLLSALQTRESS